jgi:hypothetical protein
VHNLTNGTSYTFTVTATNGVGTSAASSPSSAVVPSASVSVPAAPDAPSAAAGDQSAMVSWAAPANDGGAAVSGYDVEYSTDGGTSWTSSSSAFHTDAATGQSIDNLTNGQQYVFRVAAINSAGMGAYSSASTGVTPIGPAAAPTIIDATAGNMTVSLTWDAPGDTGGSPVLGYDVQYAASPFSSWTATPSEFDTDPATTQSIEPMTDGSPVEFRVAAVTAYGTGAYSAPSSAVTPQADATGVTAQKSRSVVYGHAATLSGVALDLVTSTGLPGNEIDLLGRTTSSGAFHLVKKLFTDSSGNFTGSVTPTATTHYELEVIGSPGHDAVTSNVFSVSVVPVIAVAASTTRVARHGLAELYGTVKPVAAGSTVYLQVLVGRTWKTLAVHATIKRQLMPNRKRELGYILRLPTSTVGTHTYRVLRKPSAASLAGQSRGVQITVRKH